MEFIILEKIIKFFDFCVICYFEFKFLIFFFGICEYRVIEVLCRFYIRVELVFVLLFISWRLFFIYFFLDCVFMNLVFSFKLSILIIMGWGLVFFGIFLYF